MPVFCGNVPGLGTIVCAKVSTQIRKTIRKRDYIAFLPMKLLRKKTISLRNAALEIQAPIYENQELFPPTASFDSL